MPTINHAVLAASPYRDSRAGRLAAQLEGSALPATGGETAPLVLTELKPVPQRTGWLYFTAVLAGPDGRPSSTPLAIGIVSGGGRGVNPWFELRLYPTVTQAGGEIYDARAQGVERAFIDRLGRILPPGSHLMIEYESPGQAATHAELLLRVPPAATYLGYLMYQAGFRGHFKDWYISEGGHEGPRKLQANKSPTPAEARAANRANRAELTAFLKRPLPKDKVDAEIIARSRQRARKIVKQRG